VFGDVAYLQHWVLRGATVAINFQKHTSDCWYKD